MSANPLQRFKAKAKRLQHRLTTTPKASNEIAETGISDNCQVDSQASLAVPETRSSDNWQIDSQVTFFGSGAINTINIWHGFSADGVHPLVRQEVFHKISDEEMIEVTNTGADLNSHTSDGPAPLLVAVQYWLQTSERKPYTDRLNLNMKNSRSRTPSVLLIIESNERIKDLCTREVVKNEFLELLVGVWDQIDRRTRCRVRSATPLIAAVQTTDGYSFHLLLSQDVNDNSKADCKTVLYVSAFCCLNKTYFGKPSDITFNIMHGEELHIKDGRISRELLSKSRHNIELLLIQASEKFQSGQLSHHDQRLNQVNHADSLSIESYNAFLEELDQIIVTQSPSYIDENLDTNLCLSCQDFQRRAIYRQWFLHSANTVDLGLSVLAGCGICQLIKDCLPEGGFERVELYYFSVLPELSSQPIDYYERVLVRGLKNSLSELEDYLYGELSLAVMNGKYFDHCCSHISLTRNLVLTKDSERVLSILHQGNHLKDATNNSDCSFQMVAHWLHICLTQHSTCYHPHSRNMLPALPTRVVDVGPADGSQKPRLLITEGRQGLYVALSYCWGDRASLTTKAKNLKAYQKAIPFSIIPKTLRDAISVTRRLGLRYLWVDTLCIIQDSTDDWLQESKNMATIYQQCVFTIAAADAEDSEGGLFRQRKRLKTRPVHFSPLIAPFAETNQVFIFGDRQISKDALRCESRLDRRGWVLQEQLLSPRTLNFSSQELYWECPTLNASESYPAGIPVDYDNIERQRFAELKRELAVSSIASNQERVHILWQNIVSIYSRRELTQKTDKLVALAGGASQVAKLLQDKLIAGLWVKWLWCDLLWMIDRDGSFVSRDSVRSAEFKAPTWSWASVTGPVSFKHPWGTAYSRFHPCIRILGLTEKVNIKPNSVSASILARGFLIPKLAFPPMDGGRTKTAHRNPIYRETSEESMHARYWKPDVQGTSHQDALYLLVAASPEWAICLGVTATGRTEGEYERVGLAYWWLPMENPIPTHLKMQDLTLV